MIALVQRVSEARVEAAGEMLGAIGRGVLALIAVEQDDGEAEAARLVERVVGYRMFADAQGRMNRSLADIGGALLAVPQFTLAADTKRARGRASRAPRNPSRAGASSSASSRSRASASDASRRGASAPRCG